MSDIFLGLDQQDLSSLPKDFQGSVFVSSQKPEKSWSYVISLPSNVSASGATPLSKTQSISYKGETYGYPLRPWVLARLLPGEQRTEIGKQWLEAKTRSLSSVILGGGREERCYADWVIRNMGEGVYQELYAPFIQKRFGMSGLDLSSQLARTLHENQEDHTYYIYAQSNQPSDVHWNSSIEGFVVENNRITSVKIDGDVHAVEGTLHVALPIDQILSLLPDVTKSISVDAKHVQYNDAHWMRVSGDCSAFATETQFWEGEHPVILVHRISDSEALLSYDPEQKDKTLGWLAAKNLQLVDEQVFPSWTPVWGRQSHFRYYRIARYLEELGIELVGKRALFSHLSMVELKQRKEEYAGAILSDFLRVVI